MNNNQKELFKTRLVPSKPGSEQLFDEEFVTDDQSVVCLGQEFPNDEARRAWFTEELRKKLQDPEFRKIEGFPIGEDEDILKLSDPPHYTACPNPWLTDFVASHGRPYDPDELYRREPLATDVSIGKFDGLYKAHSYHTKVPHLAIVPSILHYTKPGDLVLDGFCGSGMTGVAAQWCGTAPSSYRREVEIQYRSMEKHAPEWGLRRSILSDLSPAATYMASNYNKHIDIDTFHAAAKALLTSVEADIGWMYKTNIPGKGQLLLEYTVWSEIFVCHNCGGDIVFENAAVDKTTFKIRNKISCPHCGAEGRKEEMGLRFESSVDPGSGEITQRPKRVPVEIYYKDGTALKNKVPDDDDLKVLSRVAELPLPTELPLDIFPDSQMVRVGRMATTKVKSIPDLFIPRSAHAMSTLWRKAHAEENVEIRRFLIFMVEQAIWGLSVLNRYQPSQHKNYGGSQVNRQLNGVYYVSSMYAECSPWHNLNGKVKRLVSAFKKYSAATGVSTIGTGTTSRLNIPDVCIDYIFTDPPFGENIYYADLNFLVESWHGVKSNAEPEAIVDRVRHKAIPEYQRLMYECFTEYFRVLKPGRWMTVVFSNSKAAVWNAIQVALQQSGFVVAEVTALDKKQGSFQQVMSPNAVKQDLVISVYKPNGGLEERFQKNGGTIDTAWDFVQTHLRNLSVTKLQNSELEFIIERDPRRIYDRMVAWFVRHDTPVPLSNDEFQAGMIQRFDERDGMYFLSEQVHEYDKKRAQTSQAPQMEMFVSDERSAIDWLTDFLKSRPSAYQDIYPVFIKQLGAGWKKHEERPELSDLLGSNFLCYDGKGDVPSQIHSYLSTNYKDLRGIDKTDKRLIAKAKDRWYVPDPNKAGDLEMLRERALLKEFDQYNATTKKLKVFRLEAVRAGFRIAWQNRDYEVIVSVAEKIPDQVLEEDPKLLMWYDQAVTRLGGS